MRLLRPRVRPRSKFHNVKTRVLGHTYDSRLEAHQAVLLKIRTDGHEIAGWERQVKLQLTDDPKGPKAIIDFLVHEKNGDSYYLEVKGRELPVWKLKLRLLKARYPNLRLKIVTRDGERWA